MEHCPASAPEALFHFPSLSAAGAFYGGAALLGLVSAGLLAVPGSLNALVEDLVRGGIVSGSALATWQVIHIGLILANALWSGTMAVGLVWERRSGHGRGLSFLNTAAQWFLRAVNLTGILALGVGIWRLARYLWFYLGTDIGVYLLYSMTVSEGVMVVQAAFLFVMLRRFLDSASDSAASMAYTRATGNLDSVSIPGRTATGFLVFSIVGIYLLAERLFTVTIVEEYLNDHYALLVAEHPVLIVSAIAFGLGSIANFLISRSLRKYKRNTERLLYLARKERMK